MNYDNQQRATPQSQNNIQFQNGDHIQYFDVQVGMGKKGNNLTSSNNHSNQLSTPGETLAQSNPYAHYFSKRKEKQSNERNAGGSLQKAEKFINMKSANSMVRIQQANKSAAIQGSRLIQKNLVDRNLSLKSMSSHKLSDQSHKVTIGQKLNVMNGNQASIQINNRGGIGTGLSNTHSQPNYHQSSQMSYNMKSQNQLQKMSQIYGSAEAILNSSSVDALNVPDSSHQLMALKSIDAEKEFKNGFAGSSSAAQLHNQQQLTSQRNENQNAIGMAYQYQPGSSNQQQFLKKNQKQKKLNDLSMVGSKKSSTSHQQKSPLNQRSIEGVSSHHHGGLADVQNVSSSNQHQQALQKKLKRDSSFQDAKLQLQQAASSKGLYLNMSLDKQQQTATIQSQQPTDQQSQILSQVLQSNKRSPSKQQNPQKNVGNFTKASGGGAASRNLQMNINSTTSTNPSSSQIQLRNQKLSSAQQKVGQILIHPSSLTKMQQIKNIYSMQSTQNKYVQGGNSVEHGSSSLPPHPSGLNHSFETTNQTQLDVSQQSSIQFNPAVSGTPKLNESQNSNYPNMQNTSISLVSKTISIQGQNINKKNMNQQLIPTEYGTSSSPQDVNELFTANNHRKSQQSQMTVSNAHQDKESLSMMIAKRNGVNPQSNTIGASKGNATSTQNVGASGTNANHHGGNPTSKINKVGINRQLQKGSRNFTNAANDQTMRQTQKSQWNVGSQNSKKNSYYNTKSSFGMRNSNKNIVKQSIDYSKMEVRGKGGQISHTSVKPKNAAASSATNSSNILPKPMKLSSQYNKEQQALVVEKNQRHAQQTSHRAGHHHTRNHNLSKHQQNTESMLQGGGGSSSNQQKRRKVEAYHEGPTSRSLEPAETIDIDARSDNASSSHLTSNLHQYFKQQNARNQQHQAHDSSAFLHDLDQGKQHHYVRNSNNQIPLIKNYNGNLKKNPTSTSVNASQQRHNQSDLNYIGGKNGGHREGSESLMLGQGEGSSEEQKMISKTEAQNTMSKKQLHSFVDNPIDRHANHHSTTSKPKEQNTNTDSTSQRKQQPTADNKSLEAFDYFHQQGKVFKQHMKSQQLKSRLKNLQYSQAATESQHSAVLDQQKAQVANMRGPKPNLENHSSNPSNIQSTVVSVKHQLPQIGGNNNNQSKSETKITNKFDSQVKLQKGKHESALSMQKNRNHMTEERNNKAKGSKIGSPDELSDQQTALKTPQNNTKLFKKNFQYSQNMSKNLGVNNIGGENMGANMAKKTSQVEENNSSSQLYVQDSDIEIGRQSTSQNNTKIDVQSQERISAMNESYENINVPNLINLFSKRKTSNNINNSRVDDKYSPQIKDTASYSSVERPAGKLSNPPQTVNKETGKYKIYRKNQKLEALNNQSDSSFPNVSNNDQLTDELRFAPMNGVRDGFGVGPGTANTHGGYTRQKYKRNNQQQHEQMVGGNNVNYKLPSQQCYSEIVNFDNQQHGHVQTSQHGGLPPHGPFENNQQDFNIISTFEQSFEYAFDPVNFQNLDALDPKDEFDDDLRTGKNFDMLEHQNSRLFNDNGQIIDGQQSSIPSIHSVPVVRNQKSQATYRHNHQKISVSNKYHYYNNNGNQAGMQPSLNGGADHNNNALGHQSINQHQFDNITNLNISQLSGQQDMMPSAGGYQVHRHPQSIKDGKRISNNNNTNGGGGNTKQQQDLTSFINNDTKINASQISQLSNDSDIGGLTTDMIIHNGGTRTTQNQHQQMYLSKRDGSAPHKDKQSGQNGGGGGPLSTGEEGNPFSGPKLHLFRKGQSKSSQSKQRKIKTSQYQQRFHELNSNYSNLQNYNNSIIQNYGQGAQQTGGPISAPSAQSIIGPTGFSAIQSQQAGSQVNYRQLSEGGGPINSMKKKSHSNTRKPKEGHINISEILNGNFKLQPANSKYINADQLYTDTRSQNSQGLISQNSNEFGNGPPKGINIGENSRNFNDMELQSQTYQKTNNDMMLQKDRDNSNELTTSAIMDHQFDARIQNTPSQFSTIQQNVSANMFDDGDSQDDNRPGRNTQDHSEKDKNGGNNFHFPMLAGAQSSKSNIDNMTQFNHQMSPYLGNTNSTQRLSMVRKIQNESLQLPPSATNSNNLPIDQGESYLQRLYDQQIQGMRPNTTNPTDMILQNKDGLHAQASPDPILQKPKIPVQKLLKPIKAPNHSNQSFKHPKVGNNSKHPQVFKNLQSLHSKNGQLQTKSQTQLRGVMPGLGQPSIQKLNNGYQLGLIQSHSQDTMNNKFAQLLKDDQSLPQQQLTDAKQMENTDPLLNDTQLTETELQTKTQEDLADQSSLEEDNVNASVELQNVTDQQEKQNRNQHFETTFEGFNKNNKTVADQNQIVNESSNDIEYKSKDNRLSKVTAGDKQQSSKRFTSGDGVSAAIANQPSLKQIVGDVKQQQEQQTRNGRKLSHQNTHQVPINQQQQKRSAIDQANLMQLNQLMEQEIDKNELSNNSARKDQRRENTLQRSIDAKNIQHLREKNYQEERNKFDSENKNQIFEIGQSQQNGQLPNNGGNDGPHGNHPRQSDAEKESRQKQLNGLNSINSAVPQSVTQIQAAESMTQNLVDSSQLQNSSQQQNNHIIDMKPIQADLIHHQAIYKKSDTGPAPTDQQQASTPAAGAGVRSSLAADDASPSPLNVKGVTAGASEESPEGQKMIGAGDGSEQHNNDQLVVSAHNAGGLNMNQTQTSHSIAQTPCFAETPNTTDQFKGYKIDPNDRINLSGMMLNTQQLNLPHNLMASSNGMIGVSMAGSNRGMEHKDGQGNHIMTPQMGNGSHGQVSAANTRGMSAKIQNKHGISLINQPFQPEIVESESLLESEPDEQYRKIPNKIM